MTNRSANILRGSYIAIVGGCQIFNQLIAECIEEKTGAKSITAMSINALGDSFDSAKICFLNCTKEKRANIIDTLRHDFHPHPYTGSLILLGLTPGIEIEKAALTFGVRGFLYQNDTVETLLKAIDAVLAGEVWMTRKMFSQCLDSQHTFLSNKAADLTARELEILKILPKGHSNEMIAKALCISPHTVKTHLSNIFKKINVHNRRLAVNWIDEHLSELKNS